MSPKYLCIRGLAPPRKTLSEGHRIFKRWGLMEVSVSLGSDFNTLWNPSFPLHLLRQDLMYSCVTLNSWSPCLYHLGARIAGIYHLILFFSFFLCFLTVLCTDFYLPCDPSHKMISHTHPDPDRPTHRNRGKSSNARITTFCKLNCLVHSATGTELTDKPPRPRSNEKQKSLCIPTLLLYTDTQGRPAHSLTVQSTVWSLPLTAQIASALPGVSAVPSSLCCVLTVSTANL